MPIWLRKLTYNQIIHFRQLEAEATKPKSPKGQSQLDLSKPKEAKQKHAIARPKSDDRPPQQPPQHYLVLSARFTWVPSMSKDRH